LFAFQIGEYFAISVRFSIQTVHCSELFLPDSLSVLLYYRRAKVRFVTKETQKNITVVEAGRRKKQEIDKMRRDNRIKADFVLATTKTIINSKLVLSAVEWIMNNQLKGPYNISVNPVIPSSNSTYLNWLCRNGIVWVLYGSQGSSRRPLFAAEVFWLLKS